MKKANHWSILAGLSLWGVSACISGSKGLSDEDKEKLKPYILEAAPGDIQKLDINFENKVKIVGYKTEPALAAPNTDVKITLYWKSEEKVEDGWGIFTHVVDDSGNNIANLDGNGTLREWKNNRQLMGPDRWEPGKVYVDQFSFHVPEQVGQEVQFRVGIWKENERLKITSGANDGENRAIAVKLKTGQNAPKPQPKVPALVVNKLDEKEKIVIDGKADDKAWTTAATTGAFVDVATGEPNKTFPVNGQAKMTWDDKNLYVLFEVSDPNVLGGFKDAKSQADKFTAAGQPKLWTEDTVEIMADPEGDGDNNEYYEIQINPQNKVFHSFFETLQKPNGGPNGPFGHEELEMKIQSAVSVKGTLDKASDKDEGYVVEAAIPWASFSKSKTPPQSGHVWRMNFYAMEKNSGTAWSPILGQGNFHAAKRFGRVTWIDPKAPPPVAPATSPLSPKLLDSMKAKGVLRLPQGVGDLKKVPPPSEPAKH